MKSKEELNALKAEVEAVSRKLRELTDEELEQVVGGSGYVVDTVCCDGCGKCVKACPLGAITIRGGAAYIAPGKCLSCGACCNVCPCGAIMPS